MKDIKYTKQKDNGDTLCEVSGYIAFIRKNIFGKGYFIDPVIGFENNPFGGRYFSMRDAKKVYEMTVLELMARDPAEKEGMEVFNYLVNKYS